MQTERRPADQDAKTLKMNEGLRNSERRWKTRQGSEKEGKDDTKNM